MPKFVTDSKFWISLIGVMVAVGVLEMNDSEQATLVQAILTVAGALGYAVSVALDQRGQPNNAPAAPLLDAWQRLSISQAEAHNRALSASPVHLEALTDALVLLNERVNALEADLGDRSR